MAGIGSIVKKTLIYLLLFEQFNTGQVIHLKPCVLAVMAWTAGTGNYRQQPQTPATASPTELWSREGACREEHKQNTLEVYLSSKQVSIAEHPLWYHPVSTASADLKEFFSETVETTTIISYKNTPKLIGMSCSVLFLQPLLFFTTL